MGWQVAVALPNNGGSGMATRDNPADPPVGTVANQARQAYIYAFPLMLMEATKLGIPHGCRRPAPRSTGFTIPTSFRTPARQP
jgi:hypothetical protein